jgi:pilus assembly protein Flp/PilA
LLHGYDGVKKCDGHVKTASRPETKLRSTTMTLASCRSAVERRMHPKMEQGGGMTTLEYVHGWLLSRCRTERAASLVEYALLVALIAVVCILAVTFLGQAASSKFSSIGSAIAG